MGEFLPRGYSQIQKLSVSQDITIEELEVIQGPIKPETEPPPPQPVPPVPING